MLDEAEPMEEPPRAAAAPARTLVVTLPYQGDAAATLGLAAYSYAHVYEAFRPLFERCGQVVALTHAESRLDYALQRAAAGGRAVAHLAFLPPHRLYVSARAANVAFPLWEFPDLPDDDFDDNPRNNWVRVANALSAIVCTSAFTRDAFVRAGVRAPVYVVPIPIAAPYFSLPPWRPGARTRLETPAHVFPAAGTPAPRQQGSLVRLAGRARGVFDRAVQPRLSPWLDRRFGEVGRAARQIWLARPSPLPPPDAGVELSGVVFTALVNPSDERKNWRDLISAYLVALRDVEDATLVVKLVVSPSLCAIELRTMLAHYHALGLTHRCRLVFLPAYLSDDQVLQLTAASTFALSATRAEGACLPVRDFLAAGRPAVAPRHSALVDYLDDEVGFVVASHPEPTYWPHDPGRHLKTTWHRLVWQSLHDQIRASYRLATDDPEGYARLAARGRERMRDHASAPRVLPRLRAVFEGLDHAGAAVR